MKYYRLEPSVKKSIIEWHTFKRKDADGNTIFLRKELGWRYGAWLISVPETDEEIKEIDAQIKKETGVEPDDFEYNPDLTGNTTSPM